MSDGEKHTDATPEAVNTSEALMSFSDLLAAFREDLDLTSDAILADRFKKDGIGSLGNFFRRLEKSKGAEQEDEYWSQVLDLAATLWGQEYLHASLKLLKDANLRLTPPLKFQDHFSDSIEYGEDYLLAQKAQEYFDTGDDVAARASISKMSTTNKKDALEKLDEGKSARNLGRKRALVIAGSVFAALTVATILSTMHFISFMRETPPSFTLPDFDMANALPDFNLSNDVQVLDEPRLDPSVSNDVFDADNVDTPQNTSGIESLADPTPIDVLENEAPVTPNDAPEGRVSDSIFSTNTASESPDMLSDSVKDEEDTTVELDADKEVDAPPSEEQGVDADNDIPDLAISPSAEEIRTCGMAFRVSAEATRLSASVEQKQKAKTFQDKFIASCGGRNLSGSQLQEAAADIPNTTIIDYAVNVIGQE